MHFKLVEKTYKTEKYVSHIRKGVYAVILMYYHTHLKYWDVGYKFEYNKNYVTPHIMAFEAINIKNGRKRTREEAFKMMNIAAPTDYNLLPKFHRDIIHKELTS